MKLRRNHKSGGFGAGLIKVVIACILVFVFMFGLLKSVGDSSEQTSDDVQYELTNNEGNYPAMYGEVVKHKNYTLSYREEHEQSEWVKYILTKENLKKPNVKRSRRFEEDPLISTKSAHYYDYRGSGYTRGHLAPAGDMAQDRIAMDESFYMSNISPQLRSFNNGIWKELEEQVRDWVFQNGDLQIMTGPVLNTELDQRIGRSEVSVPKFFYKAIVSLNPRKKKAVGFIIPHRKCTERLQEFAVSIDSLESILQLDLFHDNNNENLERSFDLKDWKFSKDRYELRINRWNDE